MENIQKILEKEILDYDDILYLLKCDKEEQKLLFRKSAEIKSNLLGKKTYLRGLIEYSNLCKKDCLYCGIRKSNKNTNRYTLELSEAMELVDFAYDNNYSSIVIQSGEIESKKFIKNINELLFTIKEKYNSEIRITLSLGEQNPEVYKKWFELGANRYLLRIETSNKELFYKIHPNDAKHNFERRINCLHSLKEIGYQLGTGVMIGLPYQKVEDLANDLIFMRKMDIDMCGMGPYLEHNETPLAKVNNLFSLEERFNLSLKMVAILRIIMKDINIAATTAMQSIDDLGREKALAIGANVIMPNLTPPDNKKNYKLYENKPCTDDEAKDCQNCMEARINLIGDKVAYGEFGDSLHFKNSN